MLTDCIVVFLSENFFLIWKHLLIVEVKVVNIFQFQHFEVTTTSVLMAPLKMPYTLLMTIKLFTAEIALEVLFWSLKYCCHCDWLTEVYLWCLSLFEFFFFYLVTVIFSEFFWMVPLNVWFEVAFVTESTWTVRTFKVVFMGSLMSNSLLNKLEYVIAKATSEVILGSIIDDRLNYDATALFTLSALSALSACFC